ncbi:aspartyl/asparaginyl beta-hydroxylase isoform X2 [Cuculus canorus]|uniref:aspartyl/asparaginyl beta-hydroxylase isoform X2 n=1 Tax=Cuculus canorus TaxID=55661 RepID=UPI0023AB3AE2|nr:aspartyl/asparaginyl beta-hydroxylase isoform X2 [Cuculus canorus]
MASRKGFKGAGGSPGPGSSSRRETKHGGSKNGKKEGLSGSSFFTWFMVIALLGVWTSVAVVWFELVDYEEVLGKLGIYDADGDGDFDVEDAKVLLGLTKDGSNENIDSLEEVLNILAEESSDWFYGFLSFLYDVLTPFETLEEEESEAADDVDGLKERSVPAQPSSPESEETIQPAEKSYVESEHKNVDIEAEEEIQSVLHEALHSQSGERHEDVPESINDQWQVKEEIYGENFEAPTTDDFLRELENEIPEAYETADSVQKEADLLADDLGAMEPEPYETPVSYEYDMGVEKTVSDPEAPGDSELTLEDAVEHYTEDTVQGDYKEEHEPKHEKQTETQDTGVEDLPEEVNEAMEPDEIIEHFDIDKDLSESKYTEDVVATEPEESEIPVQAEDYSHDDLVGKTEKETEQDKTEKAKKKKKPKLLNKFDKTIKAELDAAEKLRKKGKVEEALRAFESLVNQYPQSPRARYGKAQSEDDLAEKMRSNEMLQKAINTYDEVASLPNVPSDLIKLSLKREADRQQFLGRMRGSLVTLQKLVQLFPNDASFKNDLGVGYLLIGDNSNAKKVYEEVLRLAPSDGFAKVHYGFILKAENKIAESIPYLKEGLESGDPGTDDGRFYFHLGDALQRMGDKEAHKWYELGYQRGHFASVWQRSLYNVKGLKAQPWWTARETGYTELVKSLEKNWKLIRDEGLAVMDKERSLFLPEDENLREKGDWSQFTLWQQGRKNEKACKSVPKTCTLLERFPEATGCRRGQIKYSIMHPGTHVWPHTGPTNCRIRMHLGLVIPKEGCRIRCAQENRTWEEGKVLIFDDSFEHEVWQDAENYRLIFIVDVWHPELTAQQRRTLPAI